MTKLSFQTHVGNFKTHVENFKTHVTNFKTHVGHFKTYVANFKTCGKFQNACWKVKSDFQNIFKLKYTSSIFWVTLYSDNGNKLVNLRKCIFKLGTLHKNTQKCTPTKKIMFISVMLHLYFFVLLHKNIVGENSCLLHKTNKCIINSRQPDSGLKHIHALARDRLLVPLDKKAP